MKKKKKRKQLDGICICCGNENTGFFYTCGKYQVCGLCNNEFFEFLLEQFLDHKEREIYETVSQEADHN